MFNWSRLECILVHTRVDGVITVGANIALDVSSYDLDEESDQHLDPSAWQKPRRTVMTWTLKGASSTLNVSP